ncbi:MAG: hypothetical protein A2583_15985 [Bdellovibrionales bacterium RIFOXYD1_FULL_53_11]|nr:MAG: hypothetical protein A2583_15985 [Bdellovibrionales bacterium RIFOXYD1_FULL_53_11]
MVELAVKGRVTNFGEDIFVQIEGSEYPIQWKSHDTWQGRIELPLNKEIEYRYVIKQNGQEIGRTGTQKRVFSKTPVQDTWG